GSRDALCQNRRVGGRQSMICGIGRSMDQQGEDLGSDGHRSRAAAQRKTLGATGTPVGVLAVSPSYQGGPSPLGSLYLSPQVARLSTASNSRPTHRLSSVAAMVNRPSTSTLLTDRRGLSQAPGRQSFTRKATARMSTSAARTSCSERSPVGSSSSME